jgi:hypothetical protein
LLEGSRGQGVDEDFNSFDNKVEGCSMRFGEEEEKDESQ